MRARISTLLSLLIALLVFMTTDAAECTDAEAASAESIWAEAAATSACSPYVTQTDPVYVNAPCTATDCVAVVEGVAKDLPDCTFSGVNNKIEVQNALTSCNGGGIEDAGSPIFATDAPAATTPTGSSTMLPSTSSASSALTPVSYCTTTEIKSMWNLFVAAATSEECTPYSSVNGEIIEILTQCDTNCTNTIRDLSNELPDCFYDTEYINKKQYVLDQLNGCEGGATSVSVSLIPDKAVEFSSSSGSSTLVSAGSTSGSGTLVSAGSTSGSGQLRSGDAPSDNILGSSSSKTGSNASPPLKGKLRLWVLLLAGIAVFVS